MATECLGSLQLCAVRVATLDQTGAPDPGPGNLYVTDSMVTLEVTREVETGTEFIQKNGCGAICLSFKDCDKDKRLNLTLDFCKVEDELLSLMTGGTNIASGADTIGLFERMISDDCPDGVSLEFWTKRVDSSGGQATLPYWHWGIPKTRWKFANFTLEDALLVPQVLGEGFGNPNFGTGPEGDWPTAFPADTLLGRFGADDFPTPECGAQELLAVS